MNTPPTEVTRSADALKELRAKWLTLSCRERAKMAEQYGTTYEGMQKFVKGWTKAPGVDKVLPLMAHFGIVRFPRRKAQKC